MSVFSRHQVDSSTTVLVAREGKRTTKTVAELRNLLDTHGYLYSWTANELVVFVEGTSVEFELVSLH
jgi:hypothetical protein